MNQNYIDNFASNADIDIKQESKHDVIKKTQKVSKNDKVKANIVCDLCGQTFKNKAQMTNHVRVKHEKLKIFKCRDCDKRYPYQGGFKAHRLNCKGVKENRWIKTGKEPTCRHPDCVNIKDQKFTPVGLIKHIMNIHSAPTEHVSSLNI